MASPSFLTTRTLSIVAIALLIPCIAAVWLLVKLENATGQSAAEILQDIARRNERPR